MPQQKGDITMQMRRALIAVVTMVQLSVLPPGRVVAAEGEERDVSMVQINQRLDALERQNQQLAAQVEALTTQNEALRAQGAQSGQSDVMRASLKPATGASQALAAPDNPAEWASRIRFGGDFRFRHENVDNAALADDRTRETIRARFGAAIKVADSIDGEIAFASGGNDPRGGSSTLGAASSRKEIGLDLAYITWRPLKSIAFTAGKMRQPFMRPGMSAFIDNEIRPEGVAVSYKGAGGVFGSAFRFWLEERAVNADSMLSGVQTGWESALGDLKIKFAASYYDYGSVQGRFPGFANSLVNELGNSITGAGANARYVYDYNIGELFAEATFPLAGLPLNVFADYARNTEAHNGLDVAYNIGFLLGKANSQGRWEAGAFTQRVEKDALFGQWADSDFAGGITDNRGQVYRVAWMAMKNLLVNVTYLDTAFNVDVGNETSYDRWQLDFNFIF